MQRTLCFDVVIYPAAPRLVREREQLLLDPKPANVQEASHNAKPIYASLIGG